MRIGGLIADDSERPLEEQTRLCVHVGDWYYEGVGATMTSLNDVEPLDSPARRHARAAASPCLRVDRAKAHLTPTDSTISASCTDRI